MHLVVLLLAGRADAQGGIGVTLVVTDGDAEQQVALGAGGKARQIIEIRPRQLVKKGRDGGFRQHRQLRRVVLGQAVVGAQRVDEQFRTPFECLRDIALEQGDTDRFADWRCPLVLPEQRAAEAQTKRRQHRRNGSTRRPLPDMPHRLAPQRDNERQHKRHTIDAEQRSPSGERRGRRLRIAERQPGKAGQYPAAQPFAGSP